MHLLDYVYVFVLRTDAQFGSVGRKQLHRLHFDFLSWSTRLLRDIFYCWSRRKKIVAVLFVLVKWSSLFGFHFHRRRFCGILICFFSKLNDFFSDMPTLQLCVYLLGKFGATVAFTVCYIITSEIFPTSLRHSLMGTCSMFGRIGSMVSPQTPLLVMVWYW